jgi:hypothetical protein
MMRDECAAMIKSYRAKLGCIAPGIDNYMNYIPPKNTDLQMVPREEQTTKNTLLDDLYMAVPAIAQWAN